MPTLYLHGADDGCLDARFAGRARAHLPEGSAVEVLADAGHFVQLEQPDRVAELVRSFLTSR